MKIKQWNTISYELDMSNSNGSNISVYMWQMEDKDSWKQPRSDLNFNSLFYGPTLSEQVLVTNT